MALIARCRSCSPADPGEGATSTVGSCSTDRVSQPIWPFLLSREPGGVTAAGSPRHHSPSPSASCTRPTAGPALAGLADHSGPHETPTMSTVAASRTLQTTAPVTRVSVVIPCLNEAENIAECVQRAQHVL